MDFDLLFLSKLFVYFSVRSWTYGDICWPLPDGCCATSFALPGTIYADSRLFAWLVPPWVYPPLEWRRTGEKHEIVMSARNISPTKMPFSVEIGCWKYSVNGQFQIGKWRRPSYWRFRSRRRFEQGSDNYFNQRPRRSDEMNILKRGTLKCWSQESRPRNYSLRSSSVCSFQFSSKNFFLFPQWQQCRTSYHIWFTPFRGLPSSARPCFSFTFTSLACTLRESLCNTVIYP